MARMELLIKAGIGKATKQPSSKCFFIEFVNEWFIREV